MAHITEPLDTPFSEIGDYLGSDFSPSVIGVGGRAYLIDTSPNYLGEGRYKREGVNVINQRNTTSNRDLLLLPQDVWRYMFESWHQGAGQSNLDRDDALPFRFFESYGVDPWTKFQLSLLPATVLLHPTGTDPVFLQPHGGELAVCTGTTITFIGAGDPVTVGATPIIGIAYDGEFIYSLHSDSTIFKTTHAGTVAHTKPTADTTDIAGATFIAYVKDKLIVGAKNVLYDITGWGATTPVNGTPVYTSPVAGFTWLGAAEGNNAIYLIGGAGDRYVVHRVGISTDGTRLASAVVAVTLPDGEIGYSIGSYLGYVFIGTEHGVRMATQTTGDGDLTLGALIPTDRPVLNFEGQDRFVWYTNSAVHGKFGEGQEGFPLLPVAGLGRMDLTTFTVTQSTPAYANDLVAEGVTNRVVRNVVTWAGKRVFSVDGVGVFMESPELMAQGWVTHGTISFGVEDLKTGLYSQFKWLPLPGGEIEIEMAYDSQRYTSVAVKDEYESIRSGNLSFNGQQFSRVNVGVILRRDEVKTHFGPTLTRWEIRTVPVRGLASQWTLPICNYDEIELNGVKQNRDVREELYRLIGLVESGMVTSLQEGGKSYQVFPKDFSWIPEKLSSNGRGWQGVFMLTLEEIR